MGGIETPLVAPLERRVTGNESAGLEDADLIGKNMNVEDAAARRVRHAVEIAADALTIPSWETRLSRLRTVR